MCGEKCAQAKSNMSIFNTVHFKMGVDMLTRHPCWSKGALVQAAERLGLIGFKCSECSKEWMLKPRETTHEGLGILHAVMSGAVVMEDEEPA
jgi:hypothetical protein